ncbi:carbon monoxide dehydrogenase subunit G [Xinfangfangia sp. CPCC 101601]|uniref:Carbon monoxide dehydrogenase subunit G n=1 Tax=Pseudogemmobacter lacusdianii TaxID=3069608 RepID=A0ABU0VV23_9RHOB|nr:carbon monoxide dehydrogenase subunit G [Xinfangfangia sp. CPCC 101601]MDQ2065587.1 carbon monoxide dehydrogenase subunit G [Xinfangfangia sp. CPCC 101601]
MKLSDSRSIDAAPALVWDAILDPQVLRACIPGCESLTGSVEDGYEAVVRQKVGPVSATFTGLVRLSDIIPGQSLTISGEGKGGAAGHAKGSAAVRFDAQGAGTLLTYDVDAAVGGKLAQLGSRIIDGFAKKLADEFFTRFQAAVEAGEADAAAPEEGAAPDETGTSKKGWFRRMIGG